MKSLHTILIFVVLLSGLSCWSQASRKSISISIPTIEQEATSIWRTINDITFLSEQGYRINLPKNDLIDSLITKSKNGTFGNEDFPSIYNLLESEVYNLLESEVYNLLESEVYKQSNYTSALAKVQDQTPLINDIIQQIESSKQSWNWPFKMFGTYEVVFTLYGSGGSYDPDTGTVTLFTTTRGEFMNYKSPANTIIHEIIHMGIEESIVQKYDLSHGLKERIVDTIVFLLFGEQLPEYRVQNMGETEIDQHLKQKTDLKKLDSIIEDYLKDR